MIIGRFEYDKASDTFSGSVYTLHFQIGDVQFVPSEKQSDNGPQYRLVSESMFGQIEHGAAWKRTDKQGKPYISVELDAPLLEKPFHAALFTSENGDTASLVWNRQKAKTEAAPKAEVTKSKAKKAA